MNNIITTLTIIFSLSSTVLQENERECYKNLNSRDLNKIIHSNNIVIIDVRTLKEYEKERIENAYLASNSGILETICNEFKKTDTVLVYCENGDRSEVAAQIICSKYQFQNVFNLTGGMQEWEKKEFGIDRSKIKYEN